MPRHKAFQVRKDPCGIATNRCQKFLVREARPILHGDRRNRVQVPAYRAELSAFALDTIDEPLVRRDLNHHDQELPAKLASKYCSLFVAWLLAQRAEAIGRGQRVERAV